MSAVKTVAKTCNNKDLLKNLSTALHAVRELDRDGFSVLNVDITQHRPVIRLQNCHLCDGFSSAVTMRTRGKFGIELKKVSRLGDVQLTWFVRGN